MKTAFALTDTPVLGDGNWLSTNTGIRMGSISLCNAKKTIANGVCMDLNLFWFRDVNCRYCCGSHISSVDLYWRDWEQNMAMGGWWGIHMQPHLWKNLSCSDLLSTLPMPLLTSAHREGILIKTFVLSLQMHFRSKALLGQNSNSEMWWE